jgi:hypothetical protein
MFDFSFETEFIIPVGVPDVAAEDARPAGPAETAEPAQTPPRYQGGVADVKPKRRPTRYTTRYLRGRQRKREGERGEGERERVRKERGERGNAAELRISMF